MTWSAPLQRQANAEGWGLFWRGPGDVQLQKDDRYDRFETDGEAMRHVFLNDSDLHERALSVIIAQSPEEYHKIVEQIRLADL